MSTKTVATGRTRHKPMIVKTGWFKKKIVMVLQAEYQEKGSVITDGYGGTLDVDCKYWKDVRHLLIEAPKGDL